MNSILYEAVYVDLDQYNYHSSSSSMVLYY